MSGAPGRLVRIYSRQGCHLCEEAIAVARRLVAAPHRLEVVDIDADPALTDDYTIRVPVVEVDGAEVAQYQLDPTALALALA